MLNLKILKLKLIKESFKEEIKQKAFFDFIINVYFNLLKIINYLSENIIPGEITLHEIITNLHDIYNISSYTKCFFRINNGYKLNHLLSIFEEFEKYLFPFILLHVYKKYKTEIFDENKENIINYFEINKDKKNITKFTKRQFIDALRKFISRYLTSSDIDNEYDNNNQDGEDLPPHIQLISYLNKNDLWPLNIFYNEDKIENGFNNIKDFNFLVKHSVDLYNCLSGISFNDEGKIEKNDNYGKILKIDESEKEYNYYKDLSYFNNKNIIIENLSLNFICNNLDDFNKYFIPYNLGNIYLDYINSNDPKENLSLLAFSNSSNGLYCIQLKAKLEKIFENKDEIFTKENPKTFNNNNLADIQNLTCLKIIKNGEIYCYGTNNSKFKIFKLKDNFGNIELVQDINLKSDSVCVNNIVEYNKNKTLIISDEKHIIVFEKNEDDNNYNTYAEKKDINTGNKTYIIKVDEHTLAAFIMPDIIKFYTVDNYEFAETIVNGINSDVNSNNQKQFKMMNIIGDNNNILGVCSKEHSIYLIDIKKKILVKNNSFEGYENNFVSISKLNGNKVLLLDSTNNLILAEIHQKNGKIQDLNFIGLLKKLNQDSNLIYAFPFGINHIYFDGNNIENKCNELY